MSETAFSLRQYNEVFGAVRRALPRATEKMNPRKLITALQKRLDFENGKILEESFNQSLQSYLGILKYCKGHRIKNQILTLI
jgi:hypothetical protein